MSYREQGAATNSHVLNQWVGGIQTDTCAVSSSLFLDLVLWDPSSVVVQKTSSKCNILRKSIFSILSALDVANLTLLQSTVRCVQLRVEHVLVYLVCKLSDQLKFYKKSINFLEVNLQKKCS